MYYSIDDLLHEVNRVALEPTIENLRVGVTRNLVQLYSTIDAPSLWQGAVHYYDLDGTGGMVELPNYCKMSLELVTGEHELSAFTSAGRFDSSSVVDGHVYALPHFRQGGVLRLTKPAAYKGIATLSYWRVPLDDEGAPLVDERIWRAAVLHCQAEEARIALNRRNKQSYSGVPYQVNRAEAASAIDAARAECNKMGPGDFRRFIHARRGNLPG